jgi:hypothetical protein
MTNGEQTSESPVPSTPSTSFTSSPTADTGQENRNPGSKTTSTAEKAVEDDIDDLRFEVERSIRYNRRRQAFYEWWHRTTMFVVIIAGSGTITELFGWKLVFECAIVIAGTLDLVIGFSMKARDHHQLAHRFYELAILMDTAAEAKRRDVTLWTKRRLEIDADEPPVYCALEADCWNEAARAMGRDDDNIEVKRLNHIPLFFKATRNFCRWSGKDFRPKKRMRTKQTRFSNSDVV